MRICLVGGGRAGMMHGRNYQHHVPGARVVAVVDAAETARQKAARELGVKDTFASLPDALEGADFDAVCIATPTFTHRELAVQAARAGKHVFCEKPMALTVDEALDMLAAAAGAGVVLQLGFMRRFDEEFVEAKALIDQGAVGRLMVVRSMTRGPGLPPAWAWDPAKSNGLLGEVNSHDFDAVRWLAGSEFAWVFAATGIRKAVDVQRSHPDFYDVALTTFELADGTLGTIEGACPVDYGYDARAELLGTDGAITVGTVAQGTVVRAARDGTVVQHTFRSWRERHRGGYVAEARHFIDCVQSGAQPAVTGIDGLRALEPVIAANRSAQSRRPEQVQLHAVEQAAP